MQIRSNSCKPSLHVFATCALIASGSALRPSLASASDTDFFAAEAKAVAAAVESVAKSVVQVEVIGVADSRGGEIAADAPTAGTIVDPDGYILATSQVTARSAASILVVLPDETRLPAEVVAEDKGRELVMLKVQHDQPLPAIDFSPAENVQVGQYAIAVGRLLPSGPAAKSVGIVSALSRLEGRAMQTDARISPPFYGGPLVNIRGQILGIVVPAMPEMGGTGDKSGWYDSGIAFVAPADQILPRLEKLKAGKSVQPGKLGIVAGSRDPLADGTTISAVRVGSPAAAVEMQPGDIIRSINNVPVARHADIKQVLGSIDAGNEIAVRLLRDGMEIELKPTLVAEIPPFNPQTFGLLLDEFDNQLIVSAVFPGSRADQAGFRLGDRIVKVGGRDLKDLSGLRNRVMTLLNGREETVQISRQDEILDLKITPQSLASVWPFELPSFPAANQKDATSDDQVEIAKEATWSVTDLSLPDVPNKAAMVAPPESASNLPHALLITFSEPGIEDVKEAAETWRELASQFRVIVVVINSANADRWNPDEAEIGQRLVSVVRKRFAIQPFAVAVTGNGAGASLAMIAAFSDPSTFSGVAVPSSLQPPAIQLRENDPNAPLHLMIRNAGELPPWAELLRKTGYAVIEADTSEESLLKFAWGMGRI